jgi:NAD/NADP transhydrogenase alpha subunit
VTASTINVVGGFMITDRMLRMFKRQPAMKNDKNDKKDSTTEEQERA